MRFKILKLIASFLPTRKNCNMRRWKKKYCFNCKACFESFHNFPDILNGNIWRSRELGLDAIPVIFPLPHRSDRGMKIEYRKLSLGRKREKYNLNAAWNGESELHTQDARSSIPLRFGIISRQPTLSTPALTFSFITRYPSSIAQHMHTKYIKRFAPVPKYGVIYSRESYKDKEGEHRDWFAFAERSCGDAPSYFSPWHDVDVATSCPLPSLPDCKSRGHKCGS